MSDKQKVSNPDFVCTTNTTTKSVVDAKFAKQVTLTYRFYPAQATAQIFNSEGASISADSKKLTALPIVLGYVTNDTIEPCSSSVIRRMPDPTALNIMPKGKAKNPKKPRKAISVQCHVIPIKNVDAGKTFGLHLGSDTKQIFRKHVLYQVTPDDNDVVVNVYEKYGRHDDDDSLEFIETKKENGKEVDYYEAWLTGDIWKKFSHTYDANDVDTMMNVDLPSEAVAAIKKIYKGEVDDKGGRLSLNITFADKKTLKLLWNGGTENANANISSINPKSELLNRVQPSTYGALVKAAMEAEVGEVIISSGWRPMVGSVIHRLGLGLDVTYVKHNAKNHHVSREYGRANENLSQSEKDAYKDVREKQKALEDAKKAKKSDKEIGKLEDDLKAAKLTLLEETKAAPSTTDPKPVTEFRKALLGLKVVRHVYDPWYIDHDAGDAVDPAVNKLGHDKGSKDSGLEALHNNHLHITAADNELGFARGSK